MNAPAFSADELLVAAIRRGDAEAWNHLIARFEGRLLAFVELRARNRATAEDIVQETFVGFLTSLPNFDARRPLENYLFTIATYKLTDRLRREGRRPTLPLAPADSQSSGVEPIDGGRPASSIVRSDERRGIESAALAAALAAQVDAWRRQAQWTKIACCELLFVRGWSNKDAAESLRLSEQTVANYKHELIAKLRAHVGRQRLSEEIFPELYE